MEQVTYYEFRVHPSEIGKDRKYDEIRQGKISSEYHNDYDNPKNLDKIFESSEYSAAMRLPVADINFYDFFTSDIALQLDDFMSSTEISPYFGFFISLKVKDILSEFNISRHKCYPVNITFEGKIFKYFYLLISHENNNVNYAKSNFVERYDDSKKVDILEYQDLLELKTFEDDKYWGRKDVNEKSIVFDNELDIYSVVTSANAFFYFSEKLKQRLEKEGITGMKFYLEEELEFYLEE